MPTCSIQNPFGDVPFEIHGVVTLLELVDTGLVEFSLDPEENERAVIESIRRTYGPDVDIAIVELLPLGLHGFFGKIL
jgi:hypothetical protein